MTEVWVLELSQEVAKQRLMQRNSLSEEEAGKRISSQTTNEERRKVAHVVIDADGSLEQVRQRIDKEWHALMKRRSEALFV